MASNKTGLNPGPNMIAKAPPTNLKKNVSMKEEVTPDMGQEK